jgi:hypothetical protein
MTMRVSAYTRTVNGHAVAVSSYDRADTSGAAAEPRTRQSGLEAPPAFKAAYFKSRNPPGTWDGFVTALEQRKDLGANRIFAYALVFGAEGGVAKDPTSTASSGILALTLGDLKAKGYIPADSSVQSVTAPRELTLDQRVTVYDAYFNQLFAKAGGAAILDQLPDREIAAAVADTMMRDGIQGGAHLIQRSINKVRMANNQSALRITNAFDSDTLSYLSRMTSERDSSRFLNELADIRTSKDRSNENSRYKYFTFNRQN